MVNFNAFRVVPYRSVAEWCQDHQHWQEQEGEVSERDARVNREICGATAAEAGEEESGSDEVTEVAVNDKTTISKKSKKEDKK
jgi:hypothetical protein